MSLSAPVVGYPEEERKRLAEEQHKIRRAYIKKRRTDGYLGFPPCMEKDGTLPSYPVGPWKDGRTRIVFDLDYLHSTVNGYASESGLTPIHIEHTREHEFYTVYNNTLVTTLAGLFRTVVIPTLNGLQQMVVPVNIWKPCCVCIQIGMGKTLSRCYTETILARTDPIIAMATPGEGDDIGRIPICIRIQLLREIHSPFVDASSMNDMIIEKFSAGKQLVAIRHPVNLSTAETSMVLSISRRKRLWNSHDSGVLSAKSMNSGTNGLNQKKTYKIMYVVALVSRGRWFCVCPGCTEHGEDGFASSREWAEHYKRPLVTESSAVPERFNWKAVIPSTITTTRFTLEPYDPKHHGTGCKPLPKQDAVSIFTNSTIIKQWVKQALRALNGISKNTDITTDPSFDWVTVVREPKPFIPVIQNSVVCDSKCEVIFLGSLETTAPDGYTEHSRNDLLVLYTSTDGGACHRPAMKIHVFPGGIGQEAAVKAAQAHGFASISVVKKLGRVLPKFEQIALRTGVQVHVNDA